MDGNNTRMFNISLKNVEKIALKEFKSSYPNMEFHISGSARVTYNFSSELFSSRGNVILANFKAARELAKKINDEHTRIGKNEFVKAGNINAMGLIDEILHYVCILYRQQVLPAVMSEAVSYLQKLYGEEQFDNLLLSFIREFPPRPVYEGSQTPSEYLAQTETDQSNRAALVEEMIMLRIANENPAFKQFFMLFEDKNIQPKALYHAVWKDLEKFFAKKPTFGPDNEDLITMLRAPARNSPYDLAGQLEFIRKRWGLILGDWLERLLKSLDMIKEESKSGWGGAPGGGGNGVEMDPYEYGSISKEYERFSPDRAWMPQVVMLAKSTLVWLDQLSKKYKRQITRLDQIPDEELDEIARRGFNGLWLIGLWERSSASCRIKQICGNPDAAASAYSLDDYNIANEMGGWDALNNLRTRAWQRGIRMAADMVPNHTGMDSKWVTERPDLFMQTRDCPYPGYSFNGENLSRDGRVSVYLEDHYFSKSDCAVVFKRVDNHTGDTRYIYHGNDGTGMPWNDTAQIDFLNPAAREAVIQEILHVARNFPIIRFDAAMVLAKKHIQRLWYPEPGQGGDIASRSEFAISRGEFEKRIPEEFWREVVDRCAREVPDTLLLAEAFWMMEGYFVRTLGMHRVYNSAFMNMLKREENDKYRSTVKNTLEFDPEVLKRFVNFMNNPDEETAVVQFGDGDKYFGVCTLMVTMPGLPMFGHGQVEGFKEKYGMEYRKACWNETENQWLIDRHYREIFPLMRKRYLFAEITNFFFYDFWPGDYVNENVYAYSNRNWSEAALVLFNNAYQNTSGWVKNSCGYAKKEPDGTRHVQTSNLCEGLGLSGQSNGYCLLREQRSNTWYIRRSSEIKDKGLFVSLGGYQSQVFLDIHEVFDDRHGYYGRVCDTLNGAGVSDISVAVQELYLKDLYSSFTKVVNSSTFEKIRAVILPETVKSDLSKKAITVASVIKDLKPEVTELLKVFRTFVLGDYGAQDVYSVESVGDMLSFEEVYSRFEYNLTKMLKISSLVKDETGTLSTAAMSLLNRVLEIFKTTPYSLELSVVFLFLDVIRNLLGEKATGKDTRAVFEHWCLDRKFREVLQEIGMPSDSAYAKMEILKCLSQFEGFPLCSGEITVNAHDFVEGIFNDNTFWNSLGVNVFEDVMWYNKEKTEEFLRYAEIGYVLTGEPVALGKKREAKVSLTSWNKELQVLDQVIRLIWLAHTDSEYQTGRFLKLLKAVNVVTTPAKEAKKTTSKAENKDSDKTAPKKADVKKSETKKVLEKKPTAKTTVTKKTK